jgi:hypothetical protein
VLQILEEAVKREPKKESDCSLSSLMTLKNDKEMVG